MATTNAIKNSSGSQVCLEVEYDNDADVWIMEDPYGEITELDGGPTRGSGAGLVSDGYQSLEQRLALWGGEAGVEVLAVDVANGIGYVLVEFV